MIVIRSADEIELIRKAGRMVAGALDKIRSKIRPGIRTVDLDEIARDEITRLGGEAAFKGYKGYPANICVSINDVVVHGIPSDRCLIEGDIVSVDAGVKYRGYFADGAMTFPVGKVSPEALNLIDATRDALKAGIASANAGCRLSDVSHAIQTYVESKGFSVVRAFVGHGIGTKIHESPEIPNYGKPDRGPRLQNGMILALEPMVNQGDFEVEILDDGWTAVTKDGKLSAHFEHTIAVNNDKAEVLTIL